jgi:hypothetical protein
MDARVAGVAGAVEEQAASAAALRDAAEAAYTRACTSVSDGVGNGSLLRGEVLARWQEFVGTGEWMRSLQGQVGRLRDRVTAALTGRPAPGAELNEALESGVEVLLREAADDAAERTVTAWRGTAGGAGLLDGRTAELERASPEFAELAAAGVRDWQGQVLDLVRSEGADKRTRARALSWGVNGAGAAVMVAVFAQTGGLTGGEVAVAGGTTAVGQRVLEAVFGDSAVRDLAARAREELELRANDLLTGERSRFDALLVDAAPPPGSPGDLRAAAAALAAARREER